MKLFENDVKSKLTTSFQFWPLTCQHQLKMRVLIEQKYYSQDRNNEFIAQPGASTFRSKTGSENPTLFIRFNR